MSHREDPEKQPLLQQQSQDAQPTLSELRDRVSQAQREYMKAWSQSTNGRIPVTIMIGTTTLLCLFLIFSGLIILQDSFDDTPYLQAGKIPLEAHIMSKCPDARDCLHDMILPAMMNVSDKVDFKLSYIGSITDHDDGVLCMHGPQECLGNIIELCAAKHYPDPKIYLGFTMCLAREYKDIPKKDLIEDCALEHGINFDKLNDCAGNDDGSLSVEMLQDSFRRSAAAGIKTSCTVRVAEKTFCVRDGGEWKDCKKGNKPESLVKEIDRLYTKVNLQVGRRW